MDTLLRRRERGGSVSVGLSAVFGSYNGWPFTNAPMPVFDGSSVVSMGSAVELRSLSCELCSFESAMGSARQVKEVTSENCSLFSNVLLSSQEN